VEHRRPGGDRVAVGGVTAVDTQPTPAVELVYRNLFIGGMPGSGKSALLNRAVAAEVLTGSTCLACPAGCAECSRDESTCECYEHAHLHPDDEPDNGAGVG
jgi:aldehyde:ferredoxin oxidoreductase